ncbi:Wzz/FepE/Etk N-terminal domain-containing protein [Aliarcobacter thereius]|uniref:Tyrosine-protein kinase etk n=2 Tax=Aliarcobacter thereius TaxID=544718 RepID=A0A1C0B5Y0_9BACT|nr:Wzz/FepE/Etk N-terminal domain-containing protein [Aliarcobacter thereius]OCL96484.1 putative tyrosine-protein kinase in cps region [Aliarcobacter thereius LMG 24486]OCL98566.1 Tyrosine-protein kinase etk [Aliarcobacter thereius]QBF15557.1 putative chain length determinant protein, Wzz family [Aliarcobacter thereius LMG 24486]TLS91651.1 hypothetical protein FE244_08365 [Aliarcobacter thereius]
MQENRYIQEDEIDLRELFKIIWDKKNFIILFTLVVTILAGIYAYSKTPIYEAKSIVRIGYIGEQIVEPSNIIEQKLKIIFNVDNPQDSEEAIVTKIAVVKNVQNFIEISTESFSNEQAINKNKEVIEFLQKEYKHKIDEFILKTNINIKNIEDKIKYALDVEKIDLQKNINKIKEQKLVRVEKEIDLLKNVELKAINKKLEFNQQKLKEYQNDANRISKQISNDNTQNMLMSIQLLNTQNLILNIQNTIENLIKERENLTNLKLKDLEKNKENILNDEIKNAEIELNINFEKKLEDLNNSLVLEKLKLTNDRVKNSNIIGEIITNDFPVKPKKKLIVAVAFVTGFIISIFLVFLFNFIKQYRNEATY